MSGRRGRRPKKKGLGPKEQREFWGESTALPEPDAGFSLVGDPAAVIRSLGRPPLRSQETMASHYFNAVAERSVNLAATLAIAGHLVEPEELFGESSTPTPPGGDVVENLWSETDLEASVAATAGVPREVAECVYCTRLIGGDPTLVLHGGGNSSVKAPREDLADGFVDALFVKGSGWDMASIEAPGLTPLPLDRMRSLLGLETLSDREMMAELASARLDPAAPNPSVETLLHAFLPDRAVQHSHADVIVTLTNLGDGHEIVREVFGHDVVVVPYVMPGFDLAKAVRDRWPEEAHDGTTGMVLLNHGLFTFGETSRDAYRRHVELIDRAEVWLSREAPWIAPPISVESRPHRCWRIWPSCAARSRSRRGGRWWSVATTVRSRRFAARPDVADLANRGPLTPDHVIRTKRAPLVGRDVAGFVDREHQYFADHIGHRDLAELDPAPRVIVDPDWGVLATGSSAGAAAIASDIYAHTMPVLERAEDHLGGYRALPPADLFDMEYWELEQAKLKLAGPPGAFEGRIGLVTGAASGIGRACASALLDRGACVIGLDLDPGIGTTFASPSWLGRTADVTDRAAVAGALADGVDAFGGLDLLVVAAGVFPPSRAVADHDPDQWSHTFAVNVDSVVALLAAVHPLLVRSPASPAVAVIGSKNVAAPGKGAVAYSASKAALSQVSRITALEWAADGIRVNQVHPDAVFDTGLWSDEIIAQRAERYGLTADEYRTRNLLGAEVASAQVGELVADLLGPTFARTTGAQIPVDGGNDRVI